VASGDITEVASVPSESTYNSRWIMWVSPDHWIAATGMSAAE